MDLPRKAVVCLKEPGPASLTPGCTSRRHRQPPYPALFDTASHSGHGVHCSGPGEFILLTSLAFDSQSNPYVADTGNHRVQELDPDGRPLAARGGVHFPHGIAVDSQDDVYVSDSAGLRKFAPNGTWARSVTTSHHQAAVHHEHLPRDVGGVLRCEKRHKTSNNSWIRDACRTAMPEVASSLTEPTAT